MRTHSLKVLPVEAAGECQFYTKNSKNENVCYVKQIATMKQATSVMEREGNDFDPLAWSTSCGGELERCSFLSILFESKTETPAGKTESEIEAYLSAGDHTHLSKPATDIIVCEEFPGEVMTPSTREIAGFDPFADEHEEAARHEETTPGESTGDVEQELTEESDAEIAPNTQTRTAPHTAQNAPITAVTTQHTRVDNTHALSAVKTPAESTPVIASAAKTTAKPNSSPIAGAAESNSRVRFKIVGPATYKKPYQIWQTSADVMILPANSVLSLPDRWLHKMSRGNVQAELDTVLRSRAIKIGQIIQTTGGGDHEGGVVAKKLMHAVIAAETWVSSAHAITQMTPQCLFAADAMGAKTVVLTPFDCGTVDIDSAARAQLMALRRFLYSNKIDNVEQVYIVMSDALSYQVYTDAYAEIFYGTANISRR